MSRDGRKDDPFRAVFSLGEANVQGVVEAFTSLLTQAVRLNEKMNATIEATCDPSKILDAPIHPFDQANGLRKQAGGSFVRAVVSPSLTLLGDKSIPLVEWTAWRGPKADGRVAWLPSKLAAKPNVVWDRKLTTKTLGGVAATRDFVLYSDRELADTVDAFHCVRADDGKPVWSYTYPAPGTLDYGNSPRATPLISGDRVFLANAFGLLHCLDLKTGKVVWDMDLRDDFKAVDERKWGTCSNPLLVDGKLIVNPGGKDASLVALDPRTGKVLWKTPGRPASYGNFIVGVFGGVKQIVGHDDASLGGWDVATGKRLWEIVPPRRGDFNVPTPLQIGEHLLVTTENNRTRLFRFGASGVIDPKPIATSSDLNPDTHTPVAVKGRVFGVNQRLVCLDAKNGLKTLWSSDDHAFANYGCLIASDDRLLFFGMEGEVVLIDATADKYRELGRWTLFPDEQTGYAHPALVGTRLYVRANGSITCIDMKE
jgi:outer membrane protein assembly factor BamB